MKDPQSILDYDLQKQTPPTPQSETRQAVSQALMEQLTRYKNARLGREDTWLACWQNYLGTPSAIQDLRNFSLSEYGGDAALWRHRIHKPKAFESVETIVGYMVGAFFPNREYATLTPTMPGVSELEPVVTKYFLNKLDEAGLKAEWTLYLRQLAITGNSMIALPWRKESRPVTIRTDVEKSHMDESGYKMKSKGLVPPAKMGTMTIEKVVYDAPEFEVVNCFDYWLDPNNPHPHRANLFRRIRRTKGELLIEVEKGLHPHLTPAHVMVGPSCNTPLDNDKPKQVRTYMGEQWWPEQEIELYEFWGDVDTGKSLYKDVTVTLYGQTITRFESNPFWGGRPFIAGSYTPLVGSPYGVGVIEPALGSLHELDSITNQRLDNAELAINGMFTHVPDGVLRTEDIYTEPGRVMQVGDHTTLQPLPTPNSNFNVSYQEAQILEADIDKATGTGSFIGVGQGRSGDRVTAEEIQATRDAGGNRLTSVYTWVEHSAFNPLLNKVWQSIRQFVTEDQTIRISMNTPTGPQWLYIELEPTDLSADYAVRARGAGHIADKEYELNKRLQFLDLVGANPDMTTQLNWVEVMKDLASRFGYDDIERYLKPEPEQPAQPEGAQQIPLTPVQEGMLPGQTGAPLLDDFARQQAASGNLPELMATNMQTAGTLNPEQSQAMQAQLEELQAGEALQ